MQLEKILARALPSNYWPSQFEPVKFLVSLQISRTCPCDLSIQIRLISKSLVSWYSSTIIMLNIPHWGQQVRNFIWYAPDLHGVDNHLNWTFMNLWLTISDKLIRLKLANMFHCVFFILWGSMIVNLVLDQNITKTKTWNSHAEVVYLLTVKQH